MTRHLHLLVGPFDERMLLRPRVVCSVAARGAAVAARQAPHPSFAPLRLQSLGWRPIARLYSTADDAKPHPLIIVTDIPAPNTGHIRVLELNRPAARNAISRALLASLRDEIDAVGSQYDSTTGDEIPTPSWSNRFDSALGDGEKGPTRALVLASAVDTSFCAGADLKERRGFTQEE